jgi:hypothetical protein
MQKSDIFKYNDVGPGMGTRQCRHSSGFITVILFVGIFHTIHLEVLYVESGEPPLSLQKISLPAIMSKAGNSTFIPVAVQYLTLSIVTGVS